MYLSNKLLIEALNVSRDYTAFVSSFGTFCYIRIPFGLCHTGSVYSRLLALAMAHLPAEYWFSYLDRSVGVPGPVQVFSDTQEGDKECERRCIVKIRSLK